MNFETKHLEDITVFKLNEKKLDTNISGLLKAEFTLLLKVEGITKLIIDLSEIELCDSSGLSALLVANRLINANSGNIRLLSPSPKVLSLIKITQLDRVLQVSNTLEQAIQELND